MQSGAAVTTTNTKVNFLIGQGEWAIRPTASYYLQRLYTFTQQPGSLSPFSTGEPGSRWMGMMAQRE
ncbi:predicted protein [Lichtheimia corymbifera JMRC:FSU:9682]|uniref:Uncharacterized protein n=1 Tax=Lichtheimia corymbifera JMRC:FSU:9682 TaxID=1263082 RepID=A0A068SEL8_9FUNG|nr:predicted protein [Lichtheimia corymbifera JMRC:FSU:9682]